MIALIGQAFRIFGNNFALLAGIVFVVGVPKSFLHNLVLLFIDVSKDNLFSDIMSGIMLEFIFQPLTTGAVIAALISIRSGNNLTFGECMSSGFRNWRRLFIAGSIAGIISFIGLLAFIVPGIIFTIRYILVSYTVILERVPAIEALQRSSELSSGHRWKLFGLLAILLVGSGIAGLIAGFPMGIIESMIGRKLFIISVITESILELASAPVIIVFFLFYWQRREEELKAQPATSPEPPPLPVSDAASAQTPE